MPLVHRPFGKKQHRLHSPALCPAEPWEGKPSGPSSTCFHRGDTASSSSSSSPLELSSDSPVSNAGGAARVGLPPAGATSAAVAATGTDAVSAADVSTPGAAAAPNIFAPAVGGAVDATVFSALAPAAGAAAAGAVAAAVGASFSFAAVSPLCSCPIAAKFPALRVHAPAAPTRAEERRRGGVRWLGE